MMSSVYRSLFALFNQLYRLSMRFWTIFYTPFFGAIGQGTRVQKVDFLRNPHRIYLGSRVFIGHTARIEAITNHGGEVYYPTITIGDDTIVESYVHIASAMEITIGQSVLFASRVYVTDHDHAFDDLDCHIGAQPLKAAPVRIGDFVWLGESVMVLKGVTIGHHAVIGANSVVTHDIPPYAVAVGSPARAIRFRAFPTESI